MIKNLMMILIVCIFFLPVGYSLVDSYNGTYLGTNLESTALGGRTYAYDIDLEEIQVYNAEGEQQLLTDEVLIQIETEMLWEMQKDAWSLIVSFFLLIFETMKLLMYLIEMRLILYILIEAIPNIFIKLRDTIGNWYLLRA